jgi:LPS export ABC transporter protein LptC
MTGWVLAVAGVLAAALACRDGSRSTPTTALADTADQVLIGMSHYVTAAGVQRARVRADTAYFYSPTQSAELRAVHITFYNAGGAVSSTLTARQGTYHWRTGDMDARGSVIVVTTDGRTLRTEQLRYSETKSEVTSEVPFVFDGPNRHIEGEGFVSDPNFRDVVARHPTGTGGQFTLPDQ